MLINPITLRDDLDRLEAIEKASLRLVVQAILDFRDTAQQIFKYESDLVADIGEDLTREALDKMGVSKIDQRLFGKIDYKRARYLFHPDFAIKQALFVDSKAEKVSGRGTATLQTSQLSLIVRQFRAQQEMEVAEMAQRAEIDANLAYISSQKLEQKHIDSQLREHEMCQKIDYLMYKIQELENRIVEFESR